MTGRAFLAGLTRPSPASLAGTLAVTAALWVVCAIAIRPASLTTGRWQVGSGDDFAWLAGNLVRYHRGDPGTFHVAVVGSSATREALSSGDDLARALSTQLDRPVAVHLLIAGSLVPLEALIAADWVPPDAPGLMVMEVSARNLGVPPFQWSWLADHPRVPLDSPSMDEALREAGYGPRLRLPAPYLLAHLDFFAARHVAVLTRDHAPEPYQVHQVDSLPPPRREDWAQMEQRHRDWLANWEEHRALNEPVYRRLVARVGEQGHTTVALLQAPRNPRMRDEVEARDPESAERGRRYRAGVRTFAEELGTPLWDLVDEAGVAQGAFRDNAHIDDPLARWRYTTALADAITAAAAGERRGAR